MEWPPNICQHGGLPCLEGRRNNRAKKPGDQDPSAGFLKHETPSSWALEGLPLSQVHRARSLQAGPEPPTQSWLSGQQAFGENPGRAQRAGFLQDSGDAALRHRLHPEDLAVIRFPLLALGRGFLGYWVEWER